MPRKAKLTSSPRGRPNQGRAAQALHVYWQALARPRANGTERTRTDALRITARVLGLRGSDRLKTIRRYVNEALNAAPLVRVTLPAGTQYTTKANDLPPGAKADPELGSDARSLPAYPRIVTRAEMRDAQPAPESFWPAVIEQLETMLSATTDPKQRAHLKRQIEALPRRANPPDDL